MKLKLQMGGVLRWNIANGINLASMAANVLESTRTRLFNPITEIHNRVWDSIQAHATDT